MLVGIEASAALDARRSGVGNYTAQLIAGLQRLGEYRGDLQFVLFSNHGDQGTDLLQGSARGIYARDRLPLRMLWMQAGLPRSIARTAPDLCHFPNHLSPVLGNREIPYLVTMHDMSVYRCPEHHPLKTVAIHRAIMPVVARRSRLIVAVSERARQEILHYLKVPAERVRVVYEGIGPQFSPGVGHGYDGTVRERYALRFPYLLSVGTLEPRKNHAGLIEAFARLVRQERLPHHLAIVGARGWKERAIYEAVQSCGMAGRVHFLGYVPGADLPDLYRSAEAFAFPSWYEGFGLPVVEALACGVPSLISTDPALCEVAGQENALVVEPGSLEALASGLHRLLTDAALRAALRARGPERARAFSWEACACQTLALYQEVLGEAGRVGRRYAAG